MHVPIYATASAAYRPTACTVLEYPSKNQFWACLPLNFRSGACCVQTFYVSYTILCLIMPAHVSSVQ